ncbi:MAG: hypothetical protein ACKOWF_03650 [Chloroflexota bacterium]
MDPRHFDHFARTFAREASRRRVVAAALLAAGIAAPGLRAAPAAAQQGLAPGEPCSFDGQCDQTQGPQICGDNGIAGDGPVNCCRLEPGSCREDSDCCGALLCTAGFCRQPAGAGGLPLGAGCATSSDCAASPFGDVLCGDNLIPEDGPLTCCLDRGGACSADNQCCGEWDCRDGYCGGVTYDEPALVNPDATVTPQDGDLAPGDACLASDQCSQALGPASCGSNGSAAGAVCCLAMASPCTDDLECCDDLICAENGVAGDGGLNCCGYANAPCQTDEGCCADLFCTGGICQPLV